MCAKICINKKLKAKNSSKEYMSQNIQKSERKERGKLLNYFDNHSYVSDDRKRQNHVTLIFFKISNIITDLTQIANL